MLHLTETPLSMPRPMRLLLYGFVAVLVLIAVLTASLTVWRTLPVTLPLPSGPCAVGRMEFDWVDESRSELFLPSVQQNRELAVFVWYPAERSGTKRAAYLPSNWARRIRGTLLTARYQAVRTHAWEDVPVARWPQKAMPIIVLSSAYAALPTDYTVIAEDLASHGYVVAAPAHTYGALDVVFPDGRLAKSTSAGSFPRHGTDKEERNAGDRIVRVWTEDIGTVLKKLVLLNADCRSVFFQKLDFGRVGVVGHSFGGAASAQFCSTDDRCSAGVNMDGTLFGDAPSKGIRQPFLFLMRDARPPPSWALMLGSTTKQEWEEAWQEDYLTYRAACGTSGSCRIESVGGMRHLNFSDKAVLLNPLLRSLLRLQGAIAGERGLTLTRQRLVEFLGKRLQGQRLFCLCGQ